MTQSTVPLASIGLDIGKDVFHLVGFDLEGAMVVRRKIKRSAFEREFEKLPRCIVGMEACLSAHFVSRTLRRLGHEPRIIPAFYVKPVRKGQKNDYNDAEAIAEAALRPGIRVVSEKTQAQLDLQALHRVRARLVGRRTATINQIRAFLIEQGITVRPRPHALRVSFEPILQERAEEISPRMQSLLRGLYEDWLRLDQRIEEGRRLMTVPGIGPIISSAVVAAIGTGEAFSRGRDFGAWLGLVPKQFSTGGRSILGGISKRGSGYLRMLFVQAARVIMMRKKLWPRFSFGAWLEQAAGRLNQFKLAIAFANKLARIAWSVLRRNQAFDANPETVPAI
jgi:transposase